MECPSCIQRCECCYHHLPREEQNEERMLREYQVCGEGDNDANDVACIECTAPRPSREPVKTIKLPDIAKGQ